MTDRANPMERKKDATRSTIKGDSTGKKAAKVVETRATFIVDETKLQALKVYAVTHKMQIKEVVDDMLTEYLKNHK